MKNILCFGDSNTWGYDARTEQRFPPEVRWTGIAQTLLGSPYRIIEEGLNGRTTVLDDMLGCNKNGKKHLPVLLESHRPLDLLVIMLGTNDLKVRFTMTPADIAWGLNDLIVTARNYLGAYGPCPPILAVSPIEVADNITQTKYGDMFGEASCANSKLLPVRMEPVARQYGCSFMRASDYAAPSRVDSIHMEPEGHRAFAEAIVKKIVEIIG